jgi:hypothetical protein
MAKVELELVAEVLQENDLDRETVDRIVSQLRREAAKAADEAAANRDPLVKKQWVIVLSDPLGALPDEDLVGWVMQVPEGDSPGVAVERLVRATHDYNSSPRGRKHPAKSIAEACEVVSAKFLKEASVTVKTKLPVTALKTDNVLPDDMATKITMDDLRQPRGRSRARARG